jgi:membrane-bound metal-dependent hydrolase YbcI (DUF457 family)
MPSPVGHTLFGLGMYIAWCKNLKFFYKEWKLFLWIVVCANLPDFDLFVGIAMGNLSKVHQGVSHTLGFALVVWLVTYITLKAFKARYAVSVSFLSFLLVLLHIFLDAFNNDSRPPIGVRLLWPFSDKYFRWYPLFYPVPHSKITDVFSNSFVNAMCYEFILLFAPFLLICYFKWRKSCEKC